MTIVITKGKVTSTAGSGGVTSDVNVEEWGGVATSLGQKVMASSVPVTLASDQDTITTDAGITLEVTGSAGSLNADAIASTDVSLYRWVSVQVTGTWSGTLTFQGSNDNSTFVSVALMNTASTQATAFTTLTSNVIAHGPIAFKYFRVRMTSYSSGTANATAEFYQSPTAFASLGVSVSTINIGSITTSVTPGTSAAHLGKAEDAGHSSGDTGVMMLGVRNDSRGSLGTTDLDYVPPQFNSSGDLRVDGSAVTQPVSGTLTIEQSTPTNLKVQIFGDDTTQAIDVDSSGQLQIDVLSSALPSGAATSANQSTEITSLQLIDDVIKTDDAGFTPATDKVAMIGAEVDDTGTDSVDEGDAGALRMSTNRNLYVRIRDNAGNERGLNVDASGNIGLSAGSNLIGTVKVRDGSGIYNVDAAVVSSSGIGVVPTLLTDLNFEFADFTNDGSFKVVGNIVHDSADTLGPVKIGGKAASYEPSTSDQPSANKTAVAAADRTDGAFNLYGESVEGVNGYFFTLDNISTTYDDNPTTATSTAKECWNYRQATFSYEITKANSPTDILFEVEMSYNNGSTFTVLQNDFLGDLRESAASVGSGIKKSVTFPIAGHSIRIKATATGTTSSATFIVANAVLYLRN